MNWMDIASIVFVCVAANHLGLIKAVIGVFFVKRKTLPIISCPKCLTFWAVIVYGVAEANCHFVFAFAHDTLRHSLLFTLHSSLRLFATALFCSYAAIWLELFMYAIDTLYNKIYGKIEEYNPEEGGTAS